jgi:hypothetical protein
MVTVTAAITAESKLLITAAAADANVTNNV